MTDLELLVASLESSNARQHLSAALTREGIIGVQLGGDLVSALEQVPPADHAGMRAIAALERTLSTIPDELDVLAQRRRLCFAGSAVMSVALVAAVLWLVFDRNPAPSATVKMELLAPIVPLIGGGALFKYYGVLSGEAKVLRGDQIKITRLLRSFRAHEQKAQAS